MYGLLNNKARIGEPGAGIGQTAVPPLPRYIQPGGEVAACGKQGKYFTLFFAMVDIFFSKKLKLFCPIFVVEIWDNKVPRHQLGYPSAW